MVESRAGSAFASGTSNCTPSSRRRFLARTNRWATVRSSVRNAVAIWPAVRPKVTLSISAIWAARVSAGSLQRNIKRSSSSLSSVGGSTGTSWLLSSGRIGASRLRASIIALCAARTSQRSGSAGVPSEGHRSRARTYASCTAFSMNANRWTPNRRVSAATMRPWQARKRWSNATCDVWPQVKEEAAANECEADTRHHEGDEHRGREDCQDDERSTPCDASRARRDVGSLCVGQNFVLEDVVGDINAHKQSGVERDG